jgi:hypothetical protein
VNGVRLVLALIIMVSLSAGALSPTKTFGIEASFTQSGEASIQNLSLVETRRTPSSLYDTGNDFSLKLQGENGTIKQGPIPVSFSSPIGTFNSTDKRAYKENVTVLLRFQYNRNVETAQIFSKGKLIASKSFSSEICDSKEGCRDFCKGKEANLGCTCGDNVCQEDLNERELCPQDCSQSSDTTTDVDEQEQSDGGNFSESVDQNEVVDSGTNTGILVAVGILALIGAVILASSKVKIEA